MIRFIIPIVLIFGGCTNGEWGTLHVKAQGSGQFEVYRIESESPLQLISEEVGHYNQQMKLLVGSYLILADCSSQITVIREGVTNELVAHRIDFEIPADFSTEDRLAVQCNRFDQVRFRQLLLNQTSIQVLSGKRELLVGMVPYATPPELENSDQPLAVRIQLGAIQITGNEEETSANTYFVSPIEEKLSLTISQSIGDKLYLLPGNYVVELNGTSRHVEVKPLELVGIAAGRLKISTPPDADIDRAFQITGNPLAVEINDGHVLDFDHWYLALPGKILVRLVGSEAIEEIELAEGQQLELATKGLRVEIDCSPWEWSCLGSRKVYLYLKDEAYPFAVGVTDVPILYMQTDVWLGLEGSRDIRYQIPSSQRSAVLRAGKWRLIPEVSTKPGLVTDLVRVESIGGNTAGNTMDLNMEEENVVPLIEGRYRLANYVSSQNVDGARKKSEKILAISAATTVQETFAVLLNEKRFAQYTARKGSGSRGNRPQHSSVQGFRIRQMHYE
jgi:hypothetical protein